jgi:NAD(P)-dependent dehydrogenase (short-subunit alcohol dehydrogenase family)
MKIRDNVFIVTGAASGLGAATAKLLAQQGGRVLLADLREKEGVELAAELGERACFQPTDVSEAASGEAAIARAKSQFGALHGLINCAGIGPSERVVGRNGPHGFDSFARAISINLVGSFNMLRLAAAAISDEPANDEGERGVIINTASVAAFDGQIGQAAYSASKGGVVAMTLPIARELARFGIRVMCIAPGIFETPMMLAFPQEVQDSIARTVPFPQRLGRPAEYAALCRHIIENAMLNGEVIRLDGALRMAAK